MALLFMASSNQQTFKLRKLPSISKKKKKKKNKKKKKKKKLQQNKKKKKKKKTHNLQNKTRGVSHYGITIYIKKVC